MITMTIHWNEVDKGGHFAAWEQPQFFSEEIRAALGRVDARSKPNTDQ